MARLIKFGPEAREAVLRGAETVMKAVGSTLGPKGHNVAIDRQYGPPSVIHDGVSVAREIHLPDQFENVGAQLIKEAAQKTNDAAGDGTTTATVLCHAILAEAHRNITAGTNAMVMRSGLEKAAKAIDDNLVAMATPIGKPEEIKQVATISAQDETIGQLVADAFAKIGSDGVITVEESGTTQMWVEIKEGMQFNKGWNSVYFVTNPQLLESEIINPLILVTDHKLSSLADVVPWLEKAVKAGRKDIVIIAGSVDGDALAFLIGNKVRGNLNVLAVAAPGYGPRQKDYLEDIAVLCGANFIAQELGGKLEDITLDDFGSAARVVATEKNTTIVDGKGTKEELEDRIAGIRTILDSPEISEYDKERHEERLAKLSSGVAVVNVGAASEAEMREKKERAIDAISATKAAIAEGIVPGGETALLKASNISLKLEGDEAIGAAILIKACRRPFEQLMMLSGYDAGAMMSKLEGASVDKGIDVMDGKVKDLIKAGVVDPVKVTRSALANAVSAAIMMATTNTVLVEEPQDAKSTEQ